ncbi:MAG TPA: oligopeptide:H+ symporter [Victivallales bacterium]|nr:oligopeptide:H+ symporter [Victivallales bacterium]
MGNMAATKQPKAFYMIFFLEFWERFGFNGFNGILALFFVKSLGFSETMSFATFGTFSALVFGLMPIGGYIGDKILGTKRTIVLGAFVLMSGYFFLAFTDANTVFYALAVICVGNGFFKANPSSLLSNFYAKEDSRLHSAFTMYYMAINIGSFIAILLLPPIAAHYGWHAAFFISGIGLIFALLNFLLMRKTVMNVNVNADSKKFNVFTLLFIVVGGALVVLLCSYLLIHISLAHLILWGICAVVTIMFFKYTFKEHGIVRRKMLVAFILMLEAVIFFTLYQQMPTSLNFFAIHNVNCNVFGFHINPQSFQSLNCFWIIIMSPILAFFYNRFGLKKKDMSISAKFAFGMTLCAISFTLLYFARYYHTSTGLVSPWWLIASYFFQSTGELLISALGLAMVAQLVPNKIVGFIMGMWFLTTAVSGVTGGIVASLTAPPVGVTESLQTLGIYTHVFLEIGIITTVIAIIMWFTYPLLNRYIYAENK